MEEAGLQDEEKGKTALMYACQKFNLQVVQLLFEHEKDIVQKDGTTALMIACLA